MGDQGSFLTFEGIDGCGKSTHMAMAAEWLRARGVRELITVREPGGTDFGEEVRGIFLRRGELLPMTELLMVMAARCQHLAEVIGPAVRAGKHVLCDRFLDSTYAYQGIGRGLGMEAVRRMNSLVGWYTLEGKGHWLDKPDKTFLFDLPVEAVADRRRRSGDRFDAADAEFHERVAGCFRSLAKEEPERFIVIDAVGTLYEVWARVKAELEKLFPGGARR